MIAWNKVLTHDFSQFLKPSLRKLPLNCQFPCQTKVSVNQNNCHCHCYCHCHDCHCWLTVAPELTSDPTDPTFSPISSVKEEIESKDLSWPTASTRSAFSARTSLSSFFVCFFFSSLAAFSDSSRASSAAARAALLLACLSALLCARLWDKEAHWINPNSFDPWLV